MKYLVRFILSIESLLKNPVNWFDKQPWLLRTIVLLTLVPFISAVSILSYQSRFSSLDNNQTTTSSDLESLQLTLEKYHDSQIQEILYLREEIIELKQVLQLTDGSSESDSVLGAQDSADQYDNLRQRLEDLSLKITDDPDMKYAYIKVDEPDIVMYSKPSESSEEFKDFEIGAFYPVLEQKDNWQEIDFGDNSTAWINMKYIISFPIDENH